jgi:hypothetical protein
VAEKETPHTSEYCLARAVQCEKMAETVFLPSNKAVLLDIAKRWRALAAESGQVSLRHRVGRRIGSPSPKIGET